MSYDPWHHAEQLQLRVIWGNPGPGLRGRWVGNGIIILRHGLTQVQARCTLAHEIVHAQYDEPFIPQHLSPKAEARANRIAAQRLISPADFRRATALYESPAQIAFELDVTPKILETYMQIGQLSCAQSYKPSWIPKASSASML